MATREIKFTQSGPQNWNMPQIEYQRSLANALGAQAVAPSDVQMVSGRVVKQPMGPLLRIAQALIAKKGIANASEAEQRINEERAAKQAELMARIQSAGNPTDAARMILSTPGIDPVVQSAAFKAWADSVTKKDEDRNPWDLGDRDKYTDESAAAYAQGGFKDPSVLRLRPTADKPLAFLIPGIDPNKYAPKTVAAAVQAYQQGDHAGAYALLEQSASPDTVLRIDADREKTQAEFENAVKLRNVDYENAVRKFGVESAEARFMASLKQDADMQLETFRQGAQDKRQDKDINATAQRDEAGFQRDIAKINQELRNAILLKGIDSVEARAVIGIKAEIERARDKFLATKQAEQQAVTEAGQDRRQGVAEAGQDRRQGVTEAGQDRRQGVAESGQDRRQGVAEAGQNQRQVMGIEATAEQNALNRKAQLEEGILNREADLKKLTMQLQDSALTREQRAVLQSQAEAAQRDLIELRGAIETEQQGNRMTFDAGQQTQRLEAQAKEGQAGRDATAQNLVSQFQNQRVLQNDQQGFVAGQDQVKIAADREARKETLQGQIQQLEMRIKADAANGIANNENAIALQKMRQEFEELQQGRGFAQQTSERLGSQDFTSVQSDLERKFKESQAKQAPDKIFNMDLGNEVLLFNAATREPIGRFPKVRDKSNAREYTVNAKGKIYRYLEGQKEPIEVIDNPGGDNSSIGKLNPNDWTGPSLQAYVDSGEKDYSLLVPKPELEKNDPGFQAIALGLSQGWLSPEQGARYQLIRTAELTGAPEGMYVDASGRMVPDPEYINFKEKLAKAGATKVSQDVKLTEYQGKQTAFGIRAVPAHDKLNSMLASGFRIGMKDWYTAGPASTNWMASSDGQEYVNAGKEFVAGVLRGDSGATITDSEWEFGKNQYIPVPGDSESIIKQKQQNREQVIKGMTVGAGPGAPNIPAIGQASRPSQKPGATSKPASPQQIKPGWSIKKVP